MKLLVLVAVALLLTISVSRVAFGQATSECIAGGAVPADKPDLAADCDALLEIKRKLAGTDFLNWKADLEFQMEHVVHEYYGYSEWVTNWDNIRVDGSRVVWLNLPHETTVSGSIPAAVAKLSALKQIRLSHTRVTSIPPELGQMTNLEELSIRGARLEGSILPEVGNMSSLRYIGLDRNNLTGHIPPELGKLSNLKTLMLHDNLLTGTIPSELGEIDLHSVYLAGNSLTGCIPASWEGMMERHNHHNDLDELGLPYCDSTQTVSTPTPVPPVTTPTPTPSPIPTPTPVPQAPSSTPLDTTQEIADLRARIESLEAKIQALLDAIIRALN